MPVPETVTTLLAAFRHARAQGGDAVSAIVEAGILPAAIEMMDRLTIEAAEAAFHPGYPDGAASVLLVELDGVAAQVEADTAEVVRLCRATGAFDVRVAQDDAERALLWKGRKGAFPAMGRISPDYYVQDGVVPRTRLAEVLARIEALADEAGLRVGNVFHAGDGNLHPLVLYDGAVPGQAERAKELAERILGACIDAGGSLTGEHGVGVDKACAMPQMFSERDLEAFERLRRAFDPEGLANPGKVIPTPRLCGEVPGPYRVHPLERAGVAERFDLGANPRSGSAPRERSWRRRAPADVARGGVGAARRGERERARRADRRGSAPRPDGADPPPRGGRPHLHGRGGDPPLGAPGRARAAPASGSRSTRPATRRSGPASPRTAPGRSGTVSVRRATSSSG